MRPKGKASVQKKGGRRTSRYIREVKTRDGNENVFTPPNGLPGTRKRRNCFSCRGPGPARKKRYTSSREEEDAQMCPSAQEKQSRTHIVGECDICKEKRNGMEIRPVEGCDMDKLNYSKR